MNAPTPIQAENARGPVKLDAILKGRPREELEFLPAALETVETPPPPAPRLVAVLLVGFLVLALAWACLGRVDIVTTAPGRLVAAGGGKVVQALDGGRVTAILVRDGQRVERGQKLVLLEPTETQAELERLQGEMAAAELDVARLQVLALGRNFVAPKDASPEMVAIARREATTELRAHAARLAELSEQAGQKRAEAAAALAETHRLQSLLPLTRRRNDAYKELQRRGYGAALVQAEAEQRQVDMEQSLAVQQQRVPAVEAEVRAALQERARLDAETRRDWLTALMTAEVKAASLRREWEKARLRHEGREIVAPVDGTVQELAIHTVGGVVASGQTLMRVAPEGAGLEVEAKLANADVGFVRQAMPVELKIESFPFTRYGVVPAKILSISQDAVTPEPTANGAAGESYYLMRLSPERNFLRVDGRREALTAGMSVTAEVKTGRRRIIEFVVAPIKKVVTEAGRER